MRSKASEKGKASAYSSPSPPPFFRVFAKTTYVRFVPTGEHLAITCFFHNEIKVEKKASPPISPFLGAKG
jgi:hypothetical protein